MGLSDSTTFRTIVGVIFDTPLGWTACRWTGAVLAELSFGHTEPREAWEALSGSNGEAGDIEPVVLGSPFRNERAQMVDDWQKNQRDGKANLRSESLEPILDLAERLHRFGEGEIDDFRDILLDMTSWTSFRRRVTEACRKIPYGHTMTYAELGGQVGAPRGARAVGNVMRRNPWPLLVPCHRVVASNGKLGGYSAPAGLSMKERLLQLEARSRTASALHTLEPWAVPVAGGR